MLSRAEKYHQTISNSLIRDAVQYALVIFKEPIRQSSPIRELDKLVSHHVNTNDDCTSIIASQEENKYVKTRKKLIIQ